jgi:hypothetical protein
MMSVTAFWMPRGVMPCSRLYSICFVRRRSVSSIAPRIEPVTGRRTGSPVPLMLRAARPMVWIRELGAQEALLVGIEDRNQRDLGHVQSFAQQVDADQHVELAQAQVADDLDALDRLDVRVQVAHAHAVLAAGSR